MESLSVVPAEQSVNIDGQQFQDITFHQELIDLIVSLINTDPVYS